MSKCYLDASCQTVKVILHLSFWLVGAAGRYDDDDDDDDDDVQAAQMLTETSSV